MKLCQQMNQRCWGPAVVETFEDPPPKDLWRIQQGGGKVQAKDGRLLIEPGNPNQGMFASVARVLPGPVCGGDGVRIDAWVEVKPLAAQGGRGAAFYNLGLYLTTAGLRGGMQWDFCYLFAVGAGGTMHQVQAAQVGMLANGAIGELKADKLCHVRIEVVGRQWSCRRDNGAVLSGKMEPPAPAVLIRDNCAAGFWVTQCSQLRIAKMTYRTLAAAMPEADLAGYWAKSRFSNQADLTRFLAEQVLPLLDSPRFQTRQQAADLLIQLWPLSKPAVQAGDRRAGGFGPEAKLRLATLLEYVPTIKLVTTRPDDDEADKPPAGYAPSTQPAEPAPPPVRKKPKVRPLPAATAPAGAPQTQPERKP